MPATDKFGFLNRNQSLYFEGGRIELADSFALGLEYITKYGNTDGFFYPPQVKQVTFDPSTLRPVADIPNTERPAAVFKLPPSHLLTIDQPLSADNLRREDAGLIIHLFAFFFGTRLQFEGWGFDGKIPTKPTNSFTYAEDVPGNFVSHVYSRWKQWDAEQRKRFINILYMHQKAMSCELGWESFFFQYLIFDAIYNLFVRFGYPTTRRHKDRLIDLCDHFQIPKHEGHIDNIQSLRNELFHEALWDGDSPGTKLGNSFRSAQWLNRLNSRLIVAITGYSNIFSKSRWWTYGWQVFDKFA